MDDAEKSVGVQPISTIIVVGIGNEVVLGRTPEGLQETKDERRLRFTCGTLKSKKSGKFVSFDECPMLSCNGKE